MLDYITCGSTTDDNITSRSTHDDTTYDSITHDNVTLGPTTLSDTMRGYKKHSDLLPLQPYLIIKQQHRLNI